MSTEPVFAAPSPPLAAHRRGSNLGSNPQMPHSPPASDYTEIFIKIELLSMFSHSLYHHTIARGLVMEVDPPTQPPVSAFAGWALENRHVQISLVSGLSALSISQDINKFVDKILTNDLIFQILFDACSAASLLRLSRTCRIARGAVQYYIPRAFDVNALLKRYFPNPLEFRALQRRTNALVSGSTALQFFLRERYPGADLDIYVDDAMSEEVARWVLAQGYTFKPSSFQNPDFEIAHKEYHLDDLYDRSVDTKVLNFAKVPEGSTEEELRVQIIAAQITPMRLILGYHSTTLEKRETALLQHDHPLLDKIQRKYEGRGFTFRGESAKSLASSGFGGISGPRAIGDKHTWTLRLPVDDIASPEQSRALSRDPCVCTVWNVDNQLPLEVSATLMFHRRLAKTYMDWGEHLSDLLLKINNHPVEPGDEA
ncbi:hypothetical protein EIP86_005408 [Pleurotus ostreatoroseus]|nr:hypothetical protein EIP86_005408 [Pleurotus ostreatoroseus]